MNKNKNKNKELSLWLVKSFFAKQSFRKYPYLSGLHKIIDGALIGIVFAVAITSAIALHSQYLWTTSFSRLEITRDLARRLLDSTSLLESSFSTFSYSSRDMVPTKSEDLIYIDLPLNPKKSKKEKFDNVFSIKKIISLPLSHGY